MADKQLSLKQHADDSLFAEDDPLAALARIASFEPQGETRSKPSVSRREPEFNLEDELLKEFEQYEEPALPAVAPEVLADRAVAAEPPRFDSEPSFREPAFDADGAFDSQTIFGDEAPAAAPVLTVEPQVPAHSPIPELRSVPQPSFVGPSEPIRPAAHPVFDLEDEILKEFATFDARRSTPAAPVAAPQVLAPAQAPVVEPEWKPAATLVAPASARVEPGFAEAPEEHDRYSGYGDELPVEAQVTAESSDTGEPALDLPALDAMEAEVDPDRWHETKEPILAREAPSRTVPVVEEIPEEPALFEVEPAARERWDDEIATEAAARFDVYAEPEPVLDIDAEPSAYDAQDDVVTDTEPTVVPAATVTASAVADVSAALVEIPAQPAKQADHDLDELLAGVQRFPVNPVPPQRAAAPALPTLVSQGAAAAKQDAATSAAAVAETRSFAPSAELKPSVDDAERLAVMPAPAARRSSAFDQPRAIAPLAEVVKEAAVLPLEKAAQPILQALEAAEPAIERFVKTAEPVVQPARTAEPVDNAAERAARVTVASDVDEEEPENFDETAFELDLTEIELDMLEMEVASSVAPSLHGDQVMASERAIADMADASVAARQPVSSSRRFEPQPPPAEDYSSLPFDPSQISGEEDPVQAIAEMDVPDAPVVDHEESAVPAEPDYDIDIDAEMAHIFSQPTERPGAGAQRPGQTTQASPLTSADLDEFERALEEDFRRSLSENRAASTPDRVALTPAAYENGRREGSTGRRILVLAASVAGLVLIGGAGVYAYWGNTSRLLTTSGEPKIILADKDPVKVEPKDRGGQIVPNQDKAVYDRVSGDNKELTKQDRLVTSNEEPVDVVQKTLMPETMPMDDDQSAATDTTDTTDPRLLPDQQDKNVSTAEATDSVSPRKVRTMVVRSDGTLVARDEEPAVAAKAKTPAEQSQERSLDVTPAATAEVPERLTANDDIAKQIKEANADKSFVPAKQPADATDSSTQNTDAGTPAAADQTTAAKNDTATTADQATASDPSATTNQTAATTDQPVTTTDQAAATNDQPATTTDEGATAADQQPVTTADNSDAKPDTVPVKTEDLAAATPSAATADTSASEAADAKPADTAAVSDATPSDDTPVATKVESTTLRGNTPIPVNRPVDQPVDIVGRVTDQGNVQKTEEVASAEQTDQSVQTTATPAGAYVIQIASLPSEAEAQKSYTKLSSRFASVIGGHGVDIRKAAIKNKGTYYRVRIVAGTKQEAADLCSRYKAAGGSCLVSK